MNAGMALSDLGDKRGFMLTEVETKKRWIISDLFYADGNAICFEVDKVTEAFQRNQSAAFPFSQFAFDKVERNENSRLWEFSKRNSLAVTDFVMSHFAQVYAMPQKLLDNYPAKKDLRARAMQYAKDVLGLDIDDAATEAMPVIKISEEEAET